MLVLLITFSVLVFAANCPPSIPKTYYGTVSFDGEYLDGSFEIRAGIGSDTIGISEVVDGEYEIEISPCSGTTGSVIFYINGIETNEGGSYDGMDDWGKIEDLYLTLDGMPPESITCGDPPNVIDPGEECDGTNLAGRSINDCGTGWTGTISCSSTCEIDYSNCVFGTDDSDDTPDNSGGGSSGGGGGGGSSSSSSSTTTSSSTTSSSGDGITITGINEENETIGLSENQQPINHGMTGAVINFVSSAPGIGLVIASFLLIVGIGFVNSKKKSLAKKENSKKETEEVEEE